MKAERRLAVALAFLTLTVGVVAYRIAADSGLRRVDALVREGFRLFAAAEKERPAGRLDAEAVEARVEAVTGVRLRLPRDEGRFEYRGVARVRVLRAAAAAVHFTALGDRCLLLVAGGGLLGGAARPAAFFASPGFISGEKEGKAFVFWERRGAAFLLVSGGDLGGAFDLVRRHLSAGEG